MVKHQPFAKSLKRPAAAGGPVPLKRPALELVEKGAESDGEQAVGQPVPLKRPAAVAVKHQRSNSPRFPLPKQRPAASNTSLKRMDSDAFTLPTLGCTYNMFSELFPLIIRTVATK